jgi:DNA-binding transcriptional ArsR family regulator
MSEELYAVCPKCKNLFALSGCTVSDTTVQIFMAAGLRFHKGTRLTLRALAEKSNYSPRTVRTHLNILADVGLVVRIPLNRKNPQSKQRYGYKGCLLAA